MSLETECYKVIKGEELIGTKNYLTSYAGCHKNLCRYNRVPRCVCVCLCVCVWNSSAILKYRFTFSREVDSSLATLSHIIMAPAGLALALNHTAKCEYIRPLGRPRRRWVDNIRMDLQEVGCGYMDWIGLTQDRERWRTLVSAVMNLRVPWNVGNFLTRCKPVSFSRRTLHHGVSK